MHPNIICITYNQKHWKIKSPFIVPESSEISENWKCHNLMSFGCERTAFLLLYLSEYEETFSKYNL